MKKVYADSRIEVSKGDFIVPEACKNRGGASGIGGVSVDDLDYNPYLEEYNDSTPENLFPTETPESGGGSGEGPADQE
jgi:hypothetical protein